MVEAHFPHWEALQFRDYLISHPQVAQEYLKLKLQLAADFPNDREAYTNGKTDFVARILLLARASG